MASRRIKSQAQAHRVGLVAAGKASLPGMNQAEARDMLRGKQVAKLPATTRKRKHG